jgi:hypothetical protein
MTKTKNDFWTVKRLRILTAALPVIVVLGLTGLFTHRLHNSFAAGVSCSQSQQFNTVTPGGQLTFAVTYTLPSTMTVQLSVQVSGNGSSPAFASRTVTNSANTWSSTINTSQTMTATTTPGAYQYQGFIRDTGNTLLASCPVATFTVNPPAPGSFTVSSPAQSSSSITLNWTASSNATSYNVLRNGVGVNTTSGQSFTDASLACNTTFSYAVKASNSTGSTNSNTISVKTGACPSSGGSGGGSSGGSSGGTSSKPKSPTSSTPSPQPVATAAPTIQGSDNSSTPSSSTNTSLADTPIVTDQPSENLANNDVPVPSQPTHKRTSLGSILLNILIGIIILVALGFIGLIVLVKLRNRQQQQAVYDDYWHKMNGV